MGQGTQARQGTQSLSRDAHGCLRLELGAVTESKLRPCTSHLHFIQEENGIQGLPTTELGFKLSTRSLLLRVGGDA